MTPPGRGSPLGWFGSLGRGSACLLAVVFVNVRLLVPVPLATTCIWPKPRIRSLPDRGLVLKLTVAIPLASVSTICWDPPVPPEERVAPPDVTRKVTAAFETGLPF